jgi:Holliday junction resolvase RusA-like endonuclease
MPTYTFHLPLPPSTNSGYKQGVRYSQKKGRYVARMMKTERLQLWEEEARLRVGAWAPPPRVPLRVSITLHLSPALLRRRDIDGMQKFLIDQVVGPRRDQWIDELVVRKESGADWAEIVVEAL